VRSALTDFIERLGVLMENDGLPRIAGRLFGALLLSSEPESLDDLASRLAVSKGSVSVNARLLEQRGLIERVSQPGNRRDFYQASGDLFRRSMEHRLARWRALHEIVTGVRASGAPLDPVVEGRLEEIEAAYGHVLSAFTEVLDRWSRRPRPAGSSRQRASTRHPK
jgi:predicted transcriptional regulator